MNVAGYLEDTVTIFSVMIRVATMLVIIATFLPLFIPVIILSTVPGFIYDKWGRSKLYKHINENTEGQRKSNASENDLTNTKDLQEVTLTQGFNFLDNKFWVFQKKYTDKWREIALKWRIGSSLSSLLSDSVVLYCIYTVFLDAFKQVISVGDTLYRYRFLNQFQSSITSLFKWINDLSEQAIRMADVYHVFKMEPDFSDGDLALKKLNSGPEISLENVTFKYQNTETYVLNGIDLRIKSGEKIAIVGQNGAGKTTLIKLICKLYQPVSGKILVNNVDLADLNIKDWHRNIGILFQDYNTYPQLTVKENIIMGNPEAPVDEIAVRLAAEQADASEFINKYKNGYDQILGEKYKDGVRPSTGQWQKLAIARFFYRNAPLVIFDEPTAAIDAVSEYNIFNRIYEFFKGKTVIIISHRFSTVRNADRILVLEGGKIVEDGNHQKLMAMGGKYAEAFLLQAKGYVESIAE
jgi:ATP-binding cassette subfamily B protein